MMRWAKSLSLATGLLFGTVGLSILNRREQPKLLSDCDGALKRVVIQYTKDAEVIDPVLRDFAAKLSPETEVIVVTDGKVDVGRIEGMIGKERLRVVVAPHLITSWSRDRWLSLRHGDKNMLLCPAGEAASDAWPARKGDEQVAATLAAALKLRHERSRLYFDGGDFVTDNDNVFVTPAVKERNPTTPHLERVLGKQFDRNVILLKSAPQHHAGMFMMPIGGRRMLVGDPSFGKTLLTAGRHPMIRGIKRPDFSASTQAQFDAVADQCREAGYQVIRVPTVLDENQRSYVTYLNVIIDRQGGHPSVFMPVYEGLQTLNDKADAIWATQGFLVHRVDCTSSYALGGSLRCLVNVLDRTEN